jgi:hypothetical protein
MRLDHVSYVASHDQISDVVNRIGSQIGTAFIDGGIHPKFGTRNFTAPLLNGQYIEVVCPMDHPATDSTPFGMAVKKSLSNGGGWFTWVFATSSISELERRFGRSSIEGKRKKPDGSEIIWKQLGVFNIIEKPELPFFIEWITDDHPSKHGNPKAAIKNIEINGDAKELSKWAGVDITNHLGATQILYNEPNDIESNGIKSIEFVCGEETVVLT